MTTRRNFIKSITTIAVIGIASTNTLAKNIFQAAIKSANDFKKKVIDIIESLKSEGSNVVKKVMNGKTYVYDPYTHYPYDGGITDEKTGYRIFFHAHRPIEYGHFHTFATDENGNLIHLVLISMNKEGVPIALATVNRWVTDDKYVKSDVLKKLLNNFQMDSNLFVERRVVEFVYNTLKAYKDLIYDLFDERDKWIKDYVDKNFNEPFEDRNFEILSERKIDLRI
ncbi:Hypothetical protein IALB_1951 [Ignavibacterium album JCM 16511]|uniref:DUF6969 domain-containing protein n=1 Tax=Ignavibacterium album (strain DSM 19864 / JCM 16511 / NBRC 101810 / Mat9-16) TaxID=945713 RepID=I0AL00_IGNAJ|nr:hypothetical protein [Ignavibacterium album]AFH49657.1 Hypothetical protein IALB_1951 [Ignavibacterium album JCM 16511]